MSAYGNELVLGFVHPQLENAVKALKLKIDWKDWGEITPNATMTKYNDALLDAHKRALTKAGFKNIRPTREGRYTFATTPLGVREFAPFNLELQYDPIELGDDKTTAVFGVPISARYFPCFADWKSPSGTIDPVAFTPELQRIMDIARTEIVKAIPIFDAAIWIVKFNHY